MTTTEQIQKEKEVIDNVLKNYLGTIYENISDYTKNMIGLEILSGINKVEQEKLKADSEKEINK